MEYVLKAGLKASTTLLIFLLILPLIFASLEVSPQTLQADVNIGESKQFSINLKNDNVSDIFNIGFSETPYINYPPIIQTMLINESKDIIITISPETFGIIPLTTTISYYYYQEIPYIQKTYDVNITNVSFEPQSITIKKGDSIIWKNQDEIIRSVTYPELFDMDLQPNATFSFTFYAENSIDYYDLYLNNHGYITVTNISKSLIHDQTKDTTFNININSQFTGSTISIEPIENNFTIEYGNKKEGLLKISNTGNVTALNITLESSPNWVTFERQYFNVTVGGYRYINYVLEPVILNKTDTNKSYTVEIKAKSINAPQSTATLSLFVPYESHVVPISSNMTLEQYREITRRLMEYIASIDWEADKKEPEIIYRDTLIGVNYTEQDVYDIKRDIAYMKDDNERIKNEIKPPIDTLNTNLNTWLPILVDLNNKSMVLAEQNKERADKWVSSFLTILICLLIIAITIFVIVYMKKIHVRKFWWRVS